MPPISSSEIPRVWEIYEELGYRANNGYDSNSDRPAKQLQDLISSWRNEYRTELGVPSKDLTNWNKDQSELRKMATMFLSTNRNGSTQWPRVNKFARDAPRYEVDGERIVDLLSQLFWRQNLNNAHNMAKKSSSRTAGQRNDRDDARSPVAGGGLPGAPDHSAASKNDTGGILSDEWNGSDDGSISSLASEGVRNALQFLKPELPSTSQNDRSGILGTSLSRVGVATRSGSRLREVEGGLFEGESEIGLRGQNGAPIGLSDHADRERVSSLKRKRTSPSAETPRAPPVPGSMLRLGLPDEQETASNPVPRPSRADPGSSQGREVSDADPGPASTGQKANEAAPDPLPSIRYLILIKSRPRPRRISWANATLRNRTMDDLFEEVVNLAEVKDIQRIKFTLQGLEQDYTAKRMGRQDGIAFAEMLDDWDESMHEEMHAPINANFLFDIILDLELPEAQDEERPEMKNSGTSRRARKQYRKLIF